MFKIIQFDKFNAFLASDLHLEFYDDGGKSLINESLSKYSIHEKDICILAGDIGLVIHKNLETILEKLCSVFRYVYYVPGNHEYYHTNKQFAHNTFKEYMVKMKNLHVAFVPTVKEYEGERFLLCTLWFPRTHNAIFNRRNINDFTVIEGIMDWVFDDALSHRKFIELNLQENDILVTHHLPTALFVPDRYKSSPLTAFFLHDIENVIFNKKPKYVVCGHTHDRKQFEINGIKFICNPLGYPSERESYGRRTESMAI